MKIIKTPQAFLAILIGVVFFVFMFFRNEPKPSTYQSVKLDLVKSEIDKHIQEKVKEIQAEKSKKKVPYGKEIAEVLSVAKSMNVTPLLVTLINNAYLSFALSWLCNTKDMGIHHQVLIITTDNNTSSTINHFWPQVHTVAISGMPLKGDQKYTHAGYVKLTNFRAHVLLELLLIKQVVFQFEVDALWVRNPIPALQKYSGKDILANPVSQRPGLTAIGFLYLWPTKATIATWQELNKKLYQLDEKIKHLAPGAILSEGDNDQIYLSGLVNKRIEGLTKGELPLSDFADGKWYEMPEAKRKSTNPYVINNNWVIGNPAKISRAKRWGHWFLNEDNSCNSEQVKKIVKSNR